MWAAHGICSWCLSAFAGRWLYDPCAGPTRACSAGRTSAPATVPMPGRTAFRSSKHWERGEVHPTLQAARSVYAKATHTLVGFLFLAEPPVERVPIPHFLTVVNVHMGHPSPDLLDTVYLLPTAPRRVPRLRAVHEGAGSSPSRVPPVLTTKSSTPRQPCALSSGST